MSHDELANFVETQNIARFRALLETETHPDKREILIRLLQQEQAKSDARIQARALDRIAMRCPEKYRQ
jgi:chromosomal replication initiation ATPase DnaA